MVNMTTIENVKHISHSRKFDDDDNTNAGNEDGNDGFGELAVSVTLLCLVFLMVDFVIETLWYRSSRIMLDWL